MQPHKVSVTTCSAQYRTFASVSRSGCPTRLSQLLLSFVFYASFSLLILCCMVASFCFISSCSFMFSSQTSQTARLLRNHAAFWAICHRSAGCSGGALCPSGHWLNDMKGERRRIDRAQDDHDGKSDCLYRYKTIDKKRDNRKKKTMEK